MQKKGQKKGGGEVDLPGLTGLTNRSKRFRELFGVPNWGSRGNTEGDPAKQVKSVSFRTVDDSKVQEKEHVEKGGAKGSAGLSREQRSFARSRDAAYNWQRDIQEENTQIVPLFATLEDEQQARLQDSRLTTPQAVIDAQLGVGGFSSGITHGIFLVMRPVGAPRARDQQGVVHQNVAVLSPEELELLRQHAEENSDMTWPGI